MADNKSKIEYSAVRETSIDGVGDQYMITIKTPEGDTHVRATRKGYLEKEVARLQASVDLGEVASLEVDKATIGVYQEQLAAIENAK